MEPGAYRAFTKRLTVSLAERDDVLGLVAAGSMAERDYRPDRWSDHDFWVIVRAGAQERYRAHHDWLPGAAAIAWAFRETEHGVKVLYRDGHLLEYAVFDPDELHLARINRYRVLLDRADVAARMAQLEAATLRGATEADDAFHAGQFLTNLLVGMGRYRRGEALSAHRFIKGGAVSHLLTLLNRHVPSERGALADNLDPTRRFEQIHPELGQKLGALMLDALPHAAAGLLVLFERHVGAETVGVPPAALAAVQEQVCEIDL